VVCDNIESWRKAVGQVEREIEILAMTITCKLHFCATHMDYQYETWGSSIQSVIWMVIRW